MGWPCLLAFVTGTVEEELLFRNECLAAENRIQKTQVKTRMQLPEAGRATRDEIGYRLVQGPLLQQVQLKRTTAAAERTLLCYIYLCTNGTLSRVPSSLHEVHRGTISADALVKHNGGQHGRNVGRGLFR